MHPFTNYRDLAVPLIMGRLFAMVPAPLVLFTIVVITLIHYYLIRIFLLRTQVLINYRPRKLDLNVLIN